MIIRHIFRSCWLFAGLLIMAQPPAQADPAVPGRDNFGRCLAVDPYCNLSQLSEIERRQVFEAAHRQHLEACLAGRRCNPARLDERDRVQVAQALARLNFEVCLRGEGGCRLAALDAGQRTEVERALQARNLEYCLSGLTACDPGRLTAEQQVAVRSSYLERNFIVCLQGFQEFTGCRLDDLTDAQRQQVEGRMREANLYVCTHALLGCNDALLTPEQRARLRAAGRQ